MVYFLILTDSELSYEDYSCDFGIGFFRSMEEAEKTAEHYLKNIEGFSQYPCEYRIIEKEISDSETDEVPEYVWFIQGWNENSNLDETDIVESQCFVSEVNADVRLEEMKSEYKRDQWSVNKWRVGELHWCDGFCRV